jgi:predicted dehydrogenase
MIRFGVVGLGKMGLSHLAIANSLPGASVVAVCDTNKYVTNVLGKYARFKPYTNLEEMFDDATLDAVIVSTPVRHHPMAVRAALERGIHVFCEKPFCLNPAEGLKLAEIAEAKQLVNQVGYHYRFVAPFRAVREVLAAGVIGELTGFRAEAYGAVVLKAAGATWRSSAVDGGGCLYEYASHAIDLINFTIGRPDEVAGVALTRIFSRDVDDQVIATLRYARRRLAGQLSSNWSDASYRRMATRIAVWGEHGRIFADRQEIQVFLSDNAPTSSLSKRLRIGEVTPGWNVRYAPDLVEPVDFYLRGEEYSAQLAHFIECVQAGRPSSSSFRDACDTDVVIAMLLADARLSPQAARSSTGTRAAAG